MNLMKVERHKVGFVSKWKEECREYELEWLQKSTVLTKLYVILKKMPAQSDGRKKINNKKETDLWGKKGKGREKDTI